MSNKLQVAERVDNYPKPELDDNMPLVKRHIGYKLHLKDIQWINCDTAVEDGVVILVGQPSMIPDTRTISVTVSIPVAQVVLIAQFEQWADYI